jgi:hypothetical protein
MPEYEDENLIEYDDYDEITIDEGKIKIFDPYYEEYEEEEENHDEWISHNLDKILHDWENFKDTMVYSNIGNYMTFGHFTEYLNTQIIETQNKWDFNQEMDEEYLDFLNTISDKKLKIDNWRHKYYKEIENCASALWCSNYNVGTFEEFSAFMFQHS